MPHSHDTYPPHDSDDLSLDSSQGDLSLERGADISQPFTAYNDYLAQSRTDALQEGLRIFGAGPGTERPTGLSMDAAERSHTRRGLRVDLGGGALRGATEPFNYGGAPRPGRGSSTYDRQPFSPKPSTERTPEEVEAERERLMARMEALEAQRAADQAAAEADHAAWPTQSESHRRSPRAERHNPGDSGVTVVETGTGKVTHYDADNNVTVRDMTDQDQAAADRMRRFGQDMRAAGQNLADSLRTGAHDAAEPDDDDGNVRVIRGNNRTFNGPIAGRHGGRGY